MTLLLPLVGYRGGLAGGFDVGSPQMNVRGCVLPGMITGVNQQIRCMDTRKYLICRNTKEVLISDGRVFAIHMYFVLQKWRKRV